MTLSLTTSQQSTVTQSQSLMPRFEGIRFNGAEEHFSEITCNLAYLCEHVLNMPEEEGIAYARQLMKVKAEMVRLAEMMQPYIAV